MGHSNEEYKRTFRQTQHDWLCMTKAICIETATANDKGHEGTNCQNSQKGNHGEEADEEWQMRQCVCCPVCGQLQGCFKHLSTQQIALFKFQNRTPQNYGMWFKFMCLFTLGPGLVDRSWRNQRPTPKDSGWTCSNITNALWRSLYGSRDGGCGMMSIYTLFTWFSGSHEPRSRRTHANKPLQTLIHVLGSSDEPVQAVMKLYRILQENDHWFPPNHVGHISCVSA